MKFKFTIEAILEVPEGSQLVGDDEQGFEPCIILPTGERITVDGTIIHRKLGAEGYIEDVDLGCVCADLGVEIVEGAIHDPERIYGDGGEIDQILAGIQ